jgi:hypothetical protein
MDFHGINLESPVFRSRAVLTIKTTRQKTVVVVAMIAIADKDGKKVTQRKSSPSNSSAVTKWALANILPLPNANIIGPYGTIRTKFIIVTIRNKSAASR